MNLPSIVAALINEDDNHVGEYFAAVACVEYKGHWLLGLSKSDDDRRGYWCFPGGGIDGIETPEQAAVRECREEAGVKCAAVGSAFERYDRPGVAFVFCRVLGTPTVKYNNEFSDMGFFSIREMREMKLYHNVMELVRHCW